MKLLITCILLLNVTLFASTVTTKTVGCEVLDNVETAYTIWESNGSKGFIKFIVRNQCEVLHLNRKVKIIAEEGDYYKVTPTNMRELWVRKSVITK